MKKILPGFFAALAVMVSAVCAWGETSPVAVSHTLTGYSKTGQSVTLEYAVQVQNREDASLSSMSLSLIPHPPFLTKKTTLTVDTLGPKASATLNIKVLSPLLRDRSWFSKMPLQWAGKCTASNGKVVEFPVTSREGGVK